MTQNKVLSKIDISPVNLHFCISFYVSLKLVRIYHYAMTDILLVQFILMGVSDHFIEINCVQIRFSSTSRKNLDELEYLHQRRDAPPFTGSSDDEGHQNSPRVGDIIEIPDQYQISTITPPCGVRTTPSLNPSITISNTISIA